MFTKNCQKFSYNLAKTKKRTKINEAENILHQNNFRLMEFGVTVFDNEGKVVTVN